MYTKPAFLCGFRCFIINEQRWQLVHHRGCLEQRQIQLLDLLQSLKLGLNSGEMYEYVATIFAFDETITFSALNILLCQSFSGPPKIL